MMILLGFWAAQLCRSAWKVVGLYTMSKVLFSSIQRTKTSSLAREMKRPDCVIADLNWFSIEKLVETDYANELRDRAMPCGNVYNYDDFSAWTTFNWEYDKLSFLSDRRYTPRDNPGLHIRWCAPSMTTARNHRRPRQSRRCQPCWPPVTGRCRFRQWIIHPTVLSAWICTLNIIRA